MLPQGALASGESANSTATEGESRLKLYPTLQNGQNNGKNRHSLKVNVENSKLQLKTFLLQTFSEVIFCQQK